MIISCDTRTGAERLVSGVRQEDREVAQAGTVGLRGQEPLLHRTSDYLPG